MQELVDVVNQNQKNSESENEIAITEERNPAQTARIVAFGGNNSEHVVADDQISDALGYLHQLENENKK